MTAIHGQFKHVAQVLTQRASDLLSAQVTVTDERGLVVASSQHRSIGTRLAASNGSHAANVLRIPIRLDSQEQIRMVLAC